MVRVESRIVRAQRHADQAPVGRVGPGVVRAGDPLAAVALLPADQPRGAMAANVWKLRTRPSVPRTVRIDSLRNSKVM